MKPLLIALTFAFVACSARGAVTTINNGDGTSTLRAQYSIPTPKVADVRDDICRGIGWTALVTCSQQMIAAGQCAAGQLGTQISNPDTCPVAIDRKIRAFLLDMRKAGEVKEADDAAVKPIREADASADIQ
jgi:hypothetical protein